MAAVVAVRMIVRVTMMVMSVAVAVLVTMAVLVIVRVIVVVAVMVMMGVALRGRAVGLERREQRHHFRGEAGEQRLCLGIAP